MHTYDQFNTVWSFMCIYILQQKEANSTNLDSTYLPANQTTYRQQSRFEQYEEAGGRDDDDDDENRDNN